MYLTLFLHLFPELATTETRVLHTRNSPVLPDDEYALLESYCTDPNCSCRRVMINVAARRQGGRFLASIGFAFDPDDEFPGPYLDPLNPQSRYADTLLALVAQMLEDPAYVARLESHYRLVKQAAADPTHPVYDKLRQLDRLEEHRPRRAVRRKKRRS